MKTESQATETIGLIAGNGRFPFLVVQQARRKGFKVVVAAVKEEADPAWQSAFENDPAVELNWIAVGQLGKLIRLFQDRGVSQALMAGQVQHKTIFARSSPTWRQVLAARPDWKMLQLLSSLPQKNTAALIGGVIDLLEREGIQLMESTALLEDLLPEPGVLTQRGPSADEKRDIEFGRPIALKLAALDVGQTLLVRDQAVVAVEAMEGTDETIRRAALLAQGHSLTMIKVSRPNQDMRFDVPVIGMNTLKVLRQCQVSAVSIEARETLLLDREEFLNEANRLNIAIIAQGS